MIESHIAWKNLLFQLTLYCFIMHEIWNGLHIMLLTIVCLCIYEKHIKDWDGFLKILQPWKYPIICSDVRILAAILGYFECCKFFSKKCHNFYYVFPINNSKLHDIWLTSNLMHPFNFIILTITTIYIQISLGKILNKSPMLLRLRPYSVH